MDYRQILQTSLNNVSQKVLGDHRKLMDKVTNRTVTTSDLIKFSDVLGDAMAEVNAGIVPEQLDEYATQYIDKFYDTCQGLMDRTATSVIEAINERDGIKIGVADVFPDRSRIDHIVERFKNALDFKEVKFLTEEGVTKNITKSAATDVIRENANLRSRVGLKTYVTRDDGAGCCKWCSKLVGTFPLGKLPEYFWSVHKSCTCTFEYKSDTSFTKIRYISTESGKIRKITENL